MKKLTTTIAVFLLVAINMQAQKTFVLLSGVSNYGVDSINLYNTTKDVKALDKVFMNQKFTVAKATSKNAYSDNIRTKLNAIVRLAKPQDRIIFFFSGHGTPGGFVPYDRTLFNYQELVDIFKKAKAQYIYCFIDACMSGSVKSISNNNFGIGSGSPKICFMTASDATELSMEDSFVGHGYFTKALLKALRGMSDKNKDKQITLGEVFRYVQNDVIYRTKDAKQVQHPQLIGTYSDEMKKTVLTRW